MTTFFPDSQRLIPTVRAGGGGRGSEKKRSADNVAVRKPRTGRADTGAADHGEKPLDDDVFRVRSLLAGGHGEGETPVPIPNTSVKSLCGDDTAYSNAGK